jgi:hypothetical protein
VADRQAIWARWAGSSVVRCCTSREISGAGPAPERADYRRSLLAAAGGAGALDQEYIARTEDVLKIYEKPLSESQPVVCIDEKPVVLHEDTRPLIPMQQGRVARRDYEYLRCGTANVFLRH